MEAKSHHRAAWSIGLIVLASFIVSLGGCGGGEGESAPSPSREPTPSKAKSDGDASSTAKPDPAPISFSAGLDALKTPPVMPVIDKVLASKPVAADKAADIVVGDLSLHIPAGVVDQPATATISSIKQAPPLPEVFKRHTFGQWDITIGDKVILPKAVRLDIKLDLPDDIKARAAKPGHAARFGARYWDPAFKQWVVLPAAFNVETSTLTVLTTHLCIIAVDYDYLDWDLASTEHFNIWFYWSTIAEADLLKDEHFRRELKPDELAACEPVAKKLGVPLYVTYVGWALEEAYRKYKPTGLPVHPLDTLGNSEDILLGHKPPLGDYRANIYLIPYKDDSLYTKIYGNIWIGLGYTWNGDRVRCVTAHEYMHLIQARLLHHSLAAQEYRRWWLESMAEYGVRFVWGERSRPTMPSYDPDFLRVPLTKLLEPHEYATHVFPRYITEKARLCTINELTRRTLSIGITQLTSEHTLVVGYAADKASTLVTWKNETGFSDMMEEITALKPIEKCLAIYGRPFGETYRDMAATMLFDSDCHWLIVHSDSEQARHELLSILSRGHGVKTLKLADRERTVNLSARSEGTCDYTPFFVEHTDDEIKSGRKKTVEVVMSGDVFPTHRGTTDLYLVTDGLRRAQGIKPIPPGTDPRRRRITVGPKDMLVALVTNTETKFDRKVKVTLQHVIDLKVKPAKVTDGEVEADIKFEAEARDIPSAHDSVQFSWRFTGPDDFAEEFRGNVSSDGVARMEHKFVFPKEGDYKLELRLGSSDGTLVLASRQVDIHIGPPMATISFAADELEVHWQVPDVIEARAVRTQLGVLYRYRWTYQGKQTTTYQPLFDIHPQEEGSFPLRVELLDSTDTPVASAQTTLNVVKSDTEWKLEHHIKYDSNMKAIGEFLAKKYQVRKGSRVKHGLYFEAFTMPDPHVGKQWKIAARYEDDKLQWYRQYNAKGLISHAYQLDKDGKKHGLEIQRTASGSYTNITMTRWGHGIKQRVDRYDADTNHRFLLELYDGKGVITQRCGFARKNGRLTSQLGYTQGKPHGTFKSWRSDGTRWSEGDYHYGKKVGVWHDYDASDKVSTATTYDSNGKPVKQLRYWDGVLRSESTWDVKGNKTTRDVGP